MEVESRRRSPHLSVPVEIPVAKLLPNPASAFVVFVRDPQRFSSQEKTATVSHSVKCGIPRLERNHGKGLKGFLVALLLGEKYFFFPFLQTIGESLPEFVRCHTASFRSFSFVFFLVLPSVPSLPPAVQRREGDQTLESASPSSPSSPSSPASKNAAAAIEQGGGRKKSSRSSVRDRRRWVAAPELLAGGFSLSPRCCSPSFGSPSPEESFCRPQRRRRLQSLSHSSAGRKRRPRHPPTLPLSLSLSQSGPNLDEGGTRSRGIEGGGSCVGMPKRE